MDDKVVYLDELDDMVVFRKLVNWGEDLIEAKTYIISSLLILGMLTVEYEKVLKIRDMWSKTLLWVGDYQTRSSTVSWASF